uniref:Uncharacterized protein n=1 Tax=Arundo donax TaxID=35708 RepID=A0A0A9DVR6_ARUDO
MRGVCKGRPERLEYHQKTSHRQGRMEVSYPRARTMTRLSRFYGFHSSLFQLV